LIHQDLIRALDPVEFSRYIGIEPDPWQAEVLRHEGKRLLLNCSRQSGKSTTTATKALHTGIYKPKSLILLVSPSLRQSQELFRKVKDSYEAMDARPGLIEDNRLSMVLTNGSRIVSLPSEQATVRGFSGVNMILFDEAAQA
jgi:phage terminase large subunit-like protein